MLRQVDVVTLLFTAGGSRWSIACDRARAPRTLDALASTLPMELQLHTPKIAGQHVYWHAPFVQDVEGETDVMEAEPGAFLYWPQRQFLELTFAPLQAETAGVTVLGRIEGGLAELRELGRAVRQGHGRTPFDGRLSGTDTGAAPASRNPEIPEGLPEDLVRRRVALWRACPADVGRMLASRAVMHPSGPLFLAESEARTLHELLWWVRSGLETEDVRVSRRLAALACDKAGTRLRDFCHLRDSAGLILDLGEACGRADVPLAPLIDEAILAAGRLAAWLDLRIPWSAVDEAVRRALDETGAGTAAARGATPPTRISGHE